MWNKSLVLQMEKLNRGELIFRYFHANALLGRQAGRRQCASIEWSTLPSAIWIDLMKLIDYSLSGIGEPSGKVGEVF